MAQLKADEVPRLKLKWAFGFPGDTRAYAQPAIVGGRLFVGSAGGKVYSLDAKSGCVHWIFDAGFSVRTAVVIGGSARGAAAYFGDQRGNVFAVDAEAGMLLWKIRVEEHPAAMITGARRHAFIRPDFVGRRGSRCEPAIPLLQLSRRHRRLGCSDRRVALEKLYDH